VGRRDVRRQSALQNLGTILYDVEYGDYGMKRILRAEFLATTICRKYCSSGDNVLVKYCFQILSMPWRVRYHHVTTRHLL